MKLLSNEEIVEGIRSSYANREATLTKLYQDKTLRSAIISMLLDNNGYKEDLDEVLSQSLIRFYKLCLTNRTFELQTTYVNYIKGIAHYVWLKQLKRNKRNHTEDIDSENEWMIAIEDVQLMKKERKVVIANLLGLMGRNCKEVLMFWASGYSMVEIAEKMNYKSYKMAKKKKHKCMKQLITYLEDHPEWVEDLR